MSTQIKEKKEWETLKNNKMAKLVSQIENPSK
jgi:hypothetical protein